jgi:membrane associated rhomboid family serine protease
MACRAETRGEMTLAPRQGADRSGRGGGGRGEPQRRPWNGKQPVAGVPMFNVTPAVLWLIIANLVVHLLRSFLPSETDAQVVWNFGLVAARLTGSLPWGTVDPLPVVSHMFLHGGLDHLGLNMLALLAFGVGVERRIGTPRFLLFYLLCGLGGAAAHLVAYYGSPDPLIGASGALSGCFAGALRLVLGGGGGNLAGLRQVGIIAAVWLGTQVLFGLAGGGFGGGAPIAWWAHIGGFGVGLAIIGLFVPRHRV